MTEEEKITHVAFVDESHWNIGRFRSLGAVSLKFEDHYRLKQEVSKLLRESGVDELKWKKIKTAKYRLAAEKICGWVVERGAHGNLRIDVLAWDIEDARHKIRGRDDVENLHRMYHHLLNNVMKERWEDETCWLLRLDDNSVLRFDDIEHFLRLKEAGIIVINTAHLFREQPNLLYRHYYSVYGVSPVDSKEEPLIQVADLFAGMACFSRKCFQKYKQWESYNSSQQSFFAPPNMAKMSNSEEERFILLRTFNNECKTHKIGVSLNTCKCLKTFDPSNPINFWWYEPQTEVDRAPTRGKLQ